MCAKASDSSNKYERILNAAVKVFARKGFFRSKISEVAREAGIADGTFYLYFKCMLSKGQNWHVTIRIRVLP